MFNTHALVGLSLGAGVQSTTCLILSAEVRRRLGYPAPLPVPAGVFAEQWIGISADEASRAQLSDADYIRHKFPPIALKGGGSEYDLRHHGARIFEENRLGHRWPRRQDGPSPAVSAPRPGQRQ